MKKLYLLILLVTVVCFAGNVSVGITNSSDVYNGFKLVALLLIMTKLLYQRCLLNSQESLKPGVHQIKWSSCMVPSGRYIVKVEQNGMVNTKNVILK